MIDEPMAVDWKKFRRHQRAEFWRGMKPKLVWKVVADRTSCVFEHFEDAKTDFRSHDKALIYPKLMTTRAFESLKEFDGW